MNDVKKFATFEELKACGGTATATKSSLAKHEKLEKLLREIYAARKSATPAEPARKQ